VFLSINFVNTPPNVSIPNDNGVTSSNTRSFTSPDKTPPWIAAPIATHSSGLIPLSGSFPVIFLTASWTAGTLVDPPTNNTLCKSFAVTPASFIAFSTGILVASIKSLINSSNFALVNVMSKCFGPVASAVMNGKLICVCCIPESSILAFSAASFSLCIAILSVFRSIPLDFLNSDTKYSIILSSKSSPPSLVFPFVANTSNTPSPISSIETSNVPPPKSYTIIFWSWSSLSIPNAKAAAVGSFIILNTSSPAILPASFVACLWLSLK